jgi:hypothetical protein
VSCWLIDTVRERVTDPYAALTRHAGQEPDDDRDLTWFQVFQQVGEDRNLARPGPRLGDLPRRVDDGGQYRHAWLVHPRPRPPS